MTSRTAIALFTRDLRVHDNPTLQAAVEQAERVLPVFVLDEAILGSAYLAPNRTSFLVDALRDLDTSLRERGCDGLVVRRGDPVEETVAYFHNELHHDASASMVARTAGLSLNEARDALRRHLGVCYDICHGAVEFEEPQRAFAMLAEAGIRVGKLQLSSALRLPEVTADSARALKTFDDGVYLHQVVERHHGRLSRHVDLAPAFAALREGRAGGEWRVHCHVPVFLAQAGTFHSTQPTLTAALMSGPGRLKRDSPAWKLPCPMSRMNTRSPGRASRAMAARDSSTASRVERPR